VGVLDDLADAQQRLQILEANVDVVRLLRDDLIRRALANGATEREVSTITGVAPSYVNRVRNRRRQKQIAGKRS
jgi:hypothetical protein